MPQPYAGQFGSRRGIAYNDLVVNSLRGFVLTKPLVIGHRGASAYAPENTIAAFNLAFDMGADGIELDVELTRDGVPVVFHFSTPTHPTHGLRTLGDKTLAQVKQIDAGAWFDEKFRDEKIPTLAEVFAAVGSRGKVVVEIKWSAVKLGNADLERETAQVIRQCKNAKQVVVSSFHPIALYRMSRLVPDIPRALIYQEDLVPGLLNGPWFRWLTRPREIHPAHQMLTPKFAAWAHANKFSLTPWAIDDPNEMKRVIALGVDGIMSNKPDLLRKIVDQ